MENVGTYGGGKLEAIIESLKISPSNTVLFQYLAVNDRSGTEEDLDFMLEAFVDGYLGFKQSHKQKETEENIKKLLSVSIGEKGEEVDQLYQRFLDNPKSLDTELTNTIKHYVYKAVVSELVECAPKVIVENLVVKNSLSIEITESSWLFEDERLTSWWYLLRDTPEVKTAIKEDPLFKGVILSKDYDFSSFLCAFQCYETDSDYNLRIFINSTNDEVEDVILELGRTMD
ncbi:hypothetical protein P4V43_13740 [Brevibacillus fortis]|uniref:hypothetical protein n=1 Tax=Brevibacillus fortis TaxID=2126352 RepID=UPI002E1BB856|nr:hypothetical protein [Brevibacillus fortis]